MGLYERWTSGTDKLHVHAFSAALRELARGAVSKSQIVSAFSLDAEAEGELDAIIAEYQSLGTVEERVQYVMQMHDVMLLAEDNIYNKATCKTRLGF